MSDKKKKVNSRMDRFFNKQLYRTLMLLCDMDLPGAIEGFSTYLEVFPNDYSAYPMYATNLIKLRRFEEAEKILDEVENRYNLAPKKLDSFKEDVFLNNLYFTKTKLLCYQGKYQECLDYCREHKDVLIKHEVNFGLTLHYCIMKLDSKNSDTYRSSTDGYLYNQMIEYDYDDFIKHISKHLLDHKAKDNDEITSYFFRGFPIEKVLEEVKQYIPDKEKSYCCGFFDDYYYFRYNDCGRCLTEKNKKSCEHKYYKSRLMVTDYFKVVTFHDSSDIITISPCDNPKGLPYIDLNYIKEQEEPKVLKKNPIKTFMEKWY